MISAGNGIRWGGTVPKSVWLDFIVREWKFLLFKTQDICLWSSVFSPDVKLLYFRKWTLLTAYYFIFQKSNIVPIECLFSFEFREKLTGNVFIEQYIFFGPKISNCDASVPEGPDGDYCRFVPELVPDVCVCVQVCVCTTSAQSYWSHHPFWLGGAVDI